LGEAVHTCYTKLHGRLRYKELQFQAKSLQDPHLNAKTLGIVLHSCHPSVDGDLEIRGSQPRLVLAKSKTLPPK
jgi:hypothetical protein